MGAVVPPDADPGARLRRWRAEGAAMAFVYLDLAGVLLTNGTARLLEALPTRERDAVDQVVNGPASWDLRVGRVSPEAFWARAGATLAGAGSGLSADELRSRWFAAFEPEPAFWDLARDLAVAGHALGLVAETAADRAAALEARLALAGLFPVRLYSFALGLTKRDDLLFREALARAGGRAPVWLLDDDPAACARAAANGLLALHVTGPGSTREARARIASAPGPAPSPRP